MMEMAAPAPAPAGAAGMESGAPPAPKVRSAFPETWMWTDVTTG